VGCAANAGPAGAYRPEHPTRPDRLAAQSISSRLAGYEDVNDAERRCLDPTLRIVVGDRTILTFDRPAGKVDPSCWCGFTSALEMDPPKGSHSARP
jgi:hypothetical protein